MITNERLRGLFHRTTSRVHAQSVQSPTRREVGGMDMTGLNAREDWGKSPCFPGDRDKKWTVDWTGERYFTLTSSYTGEKKYYRTGEAYNLETATEIK